MVSLSYYGSPAPSGVQVLGLPQDTSAAAKQAITPQEPGSEFNPPPHPDVERVLARLKELDKECTALCDKLYNGTTPTYQEREEIHDKLDAADAERVSLRYILDQIYEANEGKEAGDAGKPYSDPTVKVMSPDANAAG